MLEPAPVGLQELLNFQEFSQLGVKPGLSFKLRKLEMMPVILKIKVINAQSPKLPFFLNYISLPPTLLRSPTSVVSV